MREEGILSLAAARPKTTPGPLKLLRVRALIRVPALHGRPIYQEREAGVAAGARARWLCGRQGGLGLYRLREGTPKPSLRSAVAGEESRPEYFQDSPPCPSADGRPESMKMTGVAVVGPWRRLGPGAMHRIAPTICQAAIFKTVRDSLPCGPRPSGLRPPKGFGPQAGDGSSSANTHGGLLGMTTGQTGFRAACLVVRGALLPAPIRGAAQSTPPTAGPQEGVGYGR
jgi:hypothetical protein